MSFAEGEFNKALERNRALASEVLELKERLSIAEDALRFYANPKSYASRPLCGVFSFQDVVKDDNDFADNTTNVKVAGARARKYLKKYEEVSSH